MDFGRRRAAGLGWVLVFTVGVLGSVTGCSTLGPRLNGSSGPIAWRVTDLAVVTRNVDGRPAESYRYTLHVKNVADQPITLTLMHRTVYGADGGQPGYTSTSGKWVIPSNAEWGFPVSSYQVCDSAYGCQRGVTAPLWRIVFTGTDGLNRPLSIPIEIALPATTTDTLEISPVRASPPAPGPPPVPRSTGVPGPTPPAADLGVVPVPVWKKGFEWEYRREHPTGKGTYVRAVERIETADGTDFYVVKSGTRRIYYRTRDLAVSMETLPDGIDRRHVPPHGMPWPLTAAKSWEMRYTIERPMHRSTSEVVQSCVVERGERVTVPAGTFDALKIVCRHPTTQEITRESWYAPEARHAVKERFRLTEGYEERELLRYRVDGP